jgi:hypothetical protein
MALLVEHHFTVDTQTDFDGYTENGQTYGILSGTNLGTMHQYVSAANDNVYDDGGHSEIDTAYILSGDGLPENKEPLYYKYTTGFNGSARSWYPLLDYNGSDFYAPTFDSSTLYFGHYDGGDWTLLENTSASFPTSGTATIEVLRWYDTNGYINLRVSLNGANWITTLTEVSPPFTDGYAIGMSMYGSSTSITLDDLYIATMPVHAGTAATHNPSVTSGTIDTTFDHTLIGVMKDSQQVDNNYWAVGYSTGGNRYYVATAYVPDNDLALTRLVCKMGKDSGATQVLTAKIYDDNSGLPGSLLYTSTNTVAVSGLSTTASWQAIWYFDEEALTGGTKYHIVIQSDTVATACPTWREDDTTGLYYTAYSSNGTSWTYLDSANAQFCFRAYGRPNYAIIVRMATWNDDTSSTTHSAVTYGGESMTLVRQTSATAGAGFIRSSMWILLSPSGIDGTKEVSMSITWGSPSSSKLVLASADAYTGVDQTTGYRNTGPTAQNSSGSSSSQSVTSDYGDTVLDLLFISSNSTVGARQTERGSANLAGDYMECSYEPAPGTTTTMTWTFSSQQFQYQAFPLMGAPPGLLFSNLTEGDSTSSASSYDTASVAPQSNALLLLTVINRYSSTSPNTPTVSGLGLTWTQIDSSLYFDTNPSTRRLTLFRAVTSAPPPSAGAITINLGGQTQNACTWILDQVIGANLTSPIVQSNTDMVTTITTYQLEVQQDAALGDTENRSYLAGGYADGTTAGRGPMQVWSTYPGTEVGNEQGVNSCLITIRGGSSSIDQLGFEDSGTVDAEVAGIIAEIAFYTYEAGGSTEVTPSAIAAAFGVATPSLTLTNTLAPSAVAAAFGIATPVATNFAMQQEGYQFNDDDDVEGSQTPLVAQDTGINIAADVNFRLRVLGNASGDRPSEQATLQYRLQGDPDSEWETVTT